VSGHVKMLFQKGVLGKDRCVLLFLVGVLFFLLQDPMSHFLGKNDEKNLTRKSEQTKKTIWGVEKEDTMQMQTSINETSEEGTKDGSYVNFLELRLQEILEKMDGVGNVKVFVSLADTGEVVVEKDAPYTRQNESETDAEGGMRNNTTMEDSEETVYTKDSEGNEVPFIAKEIVPTVSGVLVVCQGGGTKKVETEIKEAIQVLFGLDMNRIKVVKMKIQ